jgi:small subunit ribosomal protein S17
MADEEKDETTESEAGEGETPETEVATPADETPADETPAEEPATEETAAEPEAAAEEPEPEKPAAEPVAAAQQAPAEEPTASTAQLSKRKKRLPRGLRPQKTRPKRSAPSGQRKPIVREPKPERERGRSQERRGVVVSSAMDKTIVVKVDLIKSHPKYKKVVRRSVKFHAHDEQNAASVGDVVRIVETRPLSATKRWRLAEVLEEAR